MDRKDESHLSTKVCDAGEMEEWRAGLAGGSPRGPLGDRTQLGSRMIGVQITKSFMCCEEKRGGTPHRRVLEE